MSLAPDGSRVVRVLPDQRAIERTFDYTTTRTDVCVGTPVRVVLAGRRIGGWVVETDVVAPPGLRLRGLSLVGGIGPSPELVALSQWAAWRWCGPRAAFLRTASPPVRVRSLAAGGSESAVRVRSPAAGGSEPASEAPQAAEGLDDAWRAGASVIRLPPALDPWPWVVGSAALAGVPERALLVLVPTVARAARLAHRLRLAGWPVALMPGEWAAAAGGGRVVVGTRAAAWAPAGALGGVVVVDAHDDAYLESRRPRWDATIVTGERARRERVPWVGTSSCPPLELLARRRLVTLARSAERAGWATTELVDLRNEDPRTGLLTERLVGLARAATARAPLVAVHNRPGVASLLGCGGCRQVARCERCAGALGQAAAAGALRCPRCGLEQPAVCRWCGSTRLSILRPGVARLAGELARMLGAPVAAITAASGRGDELAAAVVVGTEAALQRVPRAGAVAFVDIDGELLGSRFRAGEETMALLARASRIVGGRSGGRVVVQTRIPEHPVLSALVHADPGLVSRAEAALRNELRLPPATALARVSGADAATWLAGGGECVPGATAPPGATVAPRTRQPSPVETLALGEQRWLLRASRASEICDALSALGPVPPGVRVDVDPRDL